MLSKPVRPDYLGECMSSFPNAALDAFNREFCLVCANRDCLRSAASQSIFDSRVNSWQSRLFTDVPRAQDGDPRYEQIRAKRFLPVSRVPEIGVTQVAAVPASAPAWGPPSAGMAPMSVQPQNATPQAVVAIPGAQNTPFHQGAVLGPSNEVQIRPGGTFMFGDDGVPGKE